MWLRSMEDSAVETAGFQPAKSLLSVLRKTLTGAHFPSTGGDSRPMYIPLIKGFLMKIRDPQGIRVESLVV